MGGHLGVAAVHLRLVEARLGDAGLKIVRHQHRSNAVEKHERPRVRSDPIAEPLRPRRFRPGVARRPERGDEQLRGQHLTSRAVDHVQRRAGIVDEQLLAGDMGLPHGRRQPPLPGAKQLAEPAVAVALGVGGAMLLPHELQRYARPLQLAMDRRPVGLCAPRLDHGQRH